MNQTTEVHCNVPTKFQNKEVLVSEDNTPVTFIKPWSVKRN